MLFQKLKENRFLKNNKGILIVLAIFCILLVLKKYEDYFNPETFEDSSSMPNRYLNIKERFQNNKNNNNNNKKNIVLNNFKKHNEYTLEELERIGKQLKLGLTIDVEDIDYNKTRLNNLIKKINSKKITNKSKKKQIEKTKLNYNKKYYHSKILEHLISKINNSSFQKINLYQDWHLEELRKYYNIDKDVKDKDELYDLIKQVLVNKELKKTKTANEKLNIRIQNLEKNNQNLTKELSKHTNDVNKYNQAFNDYLKYQEDQKKQINLLNVGSIIEDGIFKVFDINNDNDNDKNNNLNNTNTNNNNNIKKNTENFEDVDIFKGKFKNKEEGFQNIPKNNKIIKTIKTIKNNKNNKTIKNNKNTKIENNDNSEDDLDDKLFNYLKYVTNFIYEMVSKYYQNYLKNIFDIDKLTQDNQTMIGGGILFIIISMGLYFIDITS